MNNNLLNLFNSWEKNNAVKKFISIFLWPRTKKRSALLNILRFLSAIRELQKIFFTIFLQRDYQEKHYLYEKKIHQHLELALRYVSKTRGHVKENLQCIFEIIISQGLLRFRVKDSSTFEIVRKELSDLNEVGFDTKKLAEKILAFENVYHATLQVVSAEPLAFLLFLQATQDLEVELNELYSIEF